MFYQRNRVGESRYRCRGCTTGTGVLRATLYNASISMILRTWKYQSVKAETTRVSWLTRSSRCARMTRATSWMTGSASRVRKWAAANAWNYRRRVGRVVDFLQTKGIKPERIQGDAVMANKVGGCRWPHR